MVISSVCVNDGVLFIKGNIDEICQSDVYFRGEEDTIPYVIEVFKYVVVNKNELVISIPFSAFNDVKFNRNIVYYLKVNPNCGTKINVTCEKTRIKLFDTETHSIEVVVDNIGVSLNVSQLKRQFVLKCLEINEGNIHIGIEDLSAREVENTSLYLKHRYSENLWRYSDKEIYIGKFNKVGMLKTIICFNEFENDISYQYYDFVIKVEKNNCVSEYYLKYNGDYSVNTVLMHTDRKYQYQINKLDIYISGGQNIAVKTWSDYSIITRVEKVVEEVNVIKFMLEIDMGGDWTEDVLKKLVLRKRAYANEMKYCCSWSIDISKDEDDMYCIDKGKILANKIKSADEIWDAYIQINDKFYPVFCDESIKTGYFVIDSGFKICLFSSTEQRLSIYTHESDYAGDKKSNIAVLGTCFSRSVFKSDSYFNPDYKRFYDCVYTQFHSSIISITSNKLINYECKDNWNKEAVRYMPTEIEKDFFVRLKESKAQYLVIDNYIDATRPVVEIENDVYITYNKYLINSNMIRDLAKCRFIQPGTKEHYELYKKHAKLFIEKVKEIMPESHILLLEARFSLYKIDERINHIQPWENNDYIKRNNIRWDNIDNIFMSLAPQMRIVRMRNTKYVSDIYSPIPGGASPSHYQKYFYREILDKINKYVLEDVIKS